MSTKNIFFPKINRDRVANNVFGLQKNVHDDRLSFPVYGEKINLGHFRPFLRPAVLKVQNFCQNWLLAYFCIGNPKKLVSRWSADPPYSSLWGFTWQRLLTKLFFWFLFFCRVEYQLNGKIKFQYFSKIKNFSGYFHF